MPSSLSLLVDLVGNFVGVTTSPGGLGELWPTEAWFTSARHSLLNALALSSRSLLSSLMSLLLMNDELIAEYPVEIGLFGKYFCRSSSVRRDFWRASS